MLVLKVITAVILVIIFACILADKMQNERMKSLNNTIKVLIDCRTKDAEDYHAMYQRCLILDMKVNELEKENEKLKKALEKQSNTTYNYFVRCDIPNNDEATPPLTKK